MESCCSGLDCPHLTLHGDWAAQGVNDGLPLRNQYRHEKVQKMVLSAPEMSHVNEAKPGTLYRAASHHFQGHLQEFRPDRYWTDIGINR